MPTLGAGKTRLAAYRQEVATSYRFNKAPKASYLLANLALEELKLATERAEEPSREAFDRVVHRLDISAEKNEGIHQLTALRSRLLKAWIRPIVWSDIINIGTLTDGEAKRVAANVGLGEAADESAVIVASALDDFDEIHQQPKANWSEATQERELEVGGFINETTPILLGARHTTAKQFAVPSLAYDDRVNPDKSQHIDGIYYDNRHARNRPRMPYQAESGHGAHFFIDPAIPVVNARTMGNLVKSSRWPKDDRRFATARHLVVERQGIILDQTTSSTLDSISSAVFNQIINH